MDRRVEYSMVIAVVMWGFASRRKCEMDVIACMGSVHG